jgi:PGDYG protein
MNIFENIDLVRDPLAHRYVKNEIVDVVFAREVGSIASREGANHYAIGDALITGSNGDKWSVTRDRFDAKYDAVTPLKHGEDGHYRNKPLPVCAKQIHEAFAIRRVAGGDLLHGKANDWLMQYAPGDYGIVDNEKFMRVYRLLND